MADEDFKNWAERNRGEIVRSDVIGAPQRTIEDRIERLRMRLKAAPIDANVRAILLGILDLLGDEL